MLRRPHGVIYALLGVSLAVNLIGVGYFAASGFKQKSRPPRTVERTIDFVATRYPEAAGEIVRKRLEERRDELQDALSDMKEARRAARRAMREQPLDKERVATALANSRDKALRFQTVVHGAIVDALPELPESERGSLGKGATD